MKKGLLPDLVLCLIALLPAPFLVFQNSPPRHSVTAGIPAAAQRTPGKAAAEAARPKPEAAAALQEKAYAGIDQRNIFTPDGTYMKLAAKKVVEKETLFRLMGITNTGIRRALIVDPGNKILLVKTGDVIDGVSVKSIGNTSVTLRIGNKDVELKLFAVVGKKG
jgi:hypothetical protein